MDGKSPKKKLLETLSTCRGWYASDDGEGQYSCSSPLRRLKLTSRTRTLADDISSSGRPCAGERSSCTTGRGTAARRPVRLPRDAEMLPSGPLDGSRSLVTDTVPVMMCVVFDETEKRKQEAYSLLDLLDCHVSTLKW